MTEASSAAHASAVGGAPLIPLLIGVVGKRNLEGHVDAVTDAIRSKLEKVRNKYPSSPIWVLTSAAPGADWCAVVATARLAREQKAKATAPAVRLVIPLPLARTLFVQDFLPEHAARFDRLIDDRTVDLEDGPFTFEPTEIIRFALDPLDGADPTLMTRHPPVSGTSGPHRTLHYEQGALFISDNCRLLIAVMPDPADMSKVGGTARTLHYRCTGTLPRTPTQPAFDTLVAPLEKANNLSAAASFPTDDPDQHRLRRLSRELTDMSEPTEWLSPRLDRVAQLVPGTSPSWLYKKGKQGSHGAATEAGEATEEIEETTEAELLAPLKAYEFFNRDALEKYPTNRSVYDDPDGIKATLAKADPMPGPEQVAALVNLVAIRRMIADLQRDAKDRGANPAIWVLGALFVPSVLAFTLFKVTHVFETGLAYAVLVLVATGVYAALRLTRRSEVHDDYRAAAEALRVQVGWRFAGISERVERHYLPGAKYELDRVRTGISTINTAIALAHRKADQAGGPALIDVAREQWIDKQVKYFGDNRQKRRRHIALALMALTTTFCGGSGAFLSILAHQRPAWFAWVGAGGIWPFVILGVLAAVAFALRFRWILLPKKASDPHPKVLRALDWIAEKSERLGRLAERRPWIGRLLKVFYPVLWCLAPMMAGWALANLGFKQWPHNFSGPLGTIVATLNGIAGAIVFWREKFAIEPEERNYAEMVEVYAAADRALDATPGSAVVLQQQILKDVGRAALAENAAWLRAHRERPIEQIAGG